MTTIDQFESVFKAAVHDVYRYEELSVKRVLVVTDLGDEEAAAFEEHCRKLLSVLGDDVSWSHLSGSDYDDVDRLLALLKERDPDLVCSYRNLKSDAYRWPFSLGIFLNVLLRQVAPPVVVLPHPRTDDRYAWAEINTDRVLVVTDHLTGDDTLVNWGLRFTEPRGRLFLSHIEDDAAFRRFIDVIGKLPDIPTEMAEEQIRERLLKEPTEYVETCAARIRDQGKDVEVVPVIRMGHKVEDYRALVEEHQCDLVVFRTRDPENTEALALHGVAYSLALEVRKVPLLML